MTVAPDNSQYATVIDVPILSPSEPSRFDDAPLHDGDEPAAVFENGDVCHDIAIDHEDIRQLADGERAEFMSAAENLGTGLRRALQDFKRREADVLVEERQLARVLAVRVPAEAVIAAEADPSTCLQDSPGTFGAAVERLLMSVDDTLR